VLVVVLFSYSAWHHRLWVLDLGVSDLHHELQLCDKMLNMDARNCQSHPAMTSTVNHPPLTPLPLTRPPLHVPSPQSSVGTIDEQWQSERRPHLRMSSHSPRQLHCLYTLIITTFTYLPALTHPYPFYPSTALLSVSLPQ
jgi:hypothetical protein